MAVFYEWDVEVVVTYDADTNDIVDHLFQSSYADCVKQSKEPLDDDQHYDIVLVCNDDDGRSWAYMEEGKLPEFFMDADERKTRKVPQRFHNEVAKVAA